MKPLGFQDLMVKTYLFEYEATLHEVNEKGARFHNSSWEVVLQREEKMEEFLRGKYPEGTFYAYHTNEYDLNEPAFKVYCHIDSLHYIVSFDVYKLKNGEMYVSCLSCEDKEFGDDLCIVLSCYPELDTHVLEMLKQLSAYRLYFATHEVNVRREGSMIHE